MESPTFDESVFKKDKSIYKKSKANIKDYKKEELEKIPGMVELWKEIERLNLILK